MSIYGHPHVYIHAYTDTYTDAYTDVFTHAYPHVNPYTYTHVHKYAVYQALCYALSSAHSAFSRQAQQLLPRGWRSKPGNGETLIDTLLVTTNQSL